MPREDGALAGGSARRGPRPDHQKPRKAECQPPLTTLRTPGPGPAGQLCRSEPETGPDRRAPDSTFPAARCCDLQPPPGTCPARVPAAPCRARHLGASVLSGTTKSVTLVRWSVSCLLQDMLWTLMT